MISMSPFLLMSDSLMGLGFAKGLCLCYDLMIIYGFTSFPKCSLPIRTFGSRRPSVRCCWCCIFPRTVVTRVSSDYYILCTDGCLLFGMVDWWGWVSDVLLLARECWECEI